MNLQSEPDDQITEAVKCLKAGKIIAYPTEAVYGLGCNLENKEAVFKLLSLKKRNVKKGLILVAADWHQISDLIDPNVSELFVEIKSQAIGKPITWVFPASKKVPDWIRGEHQGVALRVSDHPIVKRLCETYNQPIVSTSANIEGETPAVTAVEVKKVFPNQICCIINAPLGNLNRPTEIRDAITNKVLRMG